MKCESKNIIALGTQQKLQLISIFYALIENWLVFNKYCSIFTFFCNKKEKKTWMMEDNIEEASAGIKSPVQLI